MCERKGVERCVEVVELEWELQDTPIEAGAGASS